MATAKYTEENIKSLEAHEHIRLRPGMYIGKLGDGSAPDDGIYILFKEIVDNSIDEFIMGAGNEIEITVTEHRVIVRDYGRGIPLGKVIDCVSKINTGGKYDSNAFQKSVGLNGVGSKAVNALSYYFRVQSIRDGRTKVAEFSRGIITRNERERDDEDYNGTIMTFEPDHTIFKNFKFKTEFLESQIRNYVYLNAGLTIKFNGKKFVSKNGLLDLLTEKTDETILYPIIHSRSKDIEFAITHGNSYGEEYYSFVNGQYTSQGGTHLGYFREALVKTIRDFYKKDYDASDIRTSVIAAISIKIQEPVFESQTKTKLGSQTIEPNGGRFLALIYTRLCNQRT